MLTPAGARSIVMAGLVPAIRVFLGKNKKGVDARHKAGHDGRICLLPKPQLRRPHAAGDAEPSRRRSSLSGLSRQSMHFAGSMDLQVRPAHDRAEKDGASHVLRHLA
jgi:hypothetical protein